MKKEKETISLDQLEEMIRVWQEKGRSGLKSAFPGVHVNTSKACLENVTIETDQLAATYPGLPADEAELIAEAFCEQVGFGNRNMSALLAELAKLKKKRSQPVPLREYSDEVKKQYVLYCYEKELPGGISQPELLLYILYLDELCGKKDPEAIRIKISHLAGTDGVYTPNRKKAAEMMKEIVQSEGDPAIAGWLGRLYMEGIAPGEKPDFGRAFYYLSIGAAAGFPEPRYLISDLFLRGAGVPQNRQVAGSILEELMDALYPMAAYGDFENPFPEVAYRLGNLYEAEGAPIEAARFYWLLADCVLTERRRLFSDEEDKTLSAKLAQRAGRREDRPKPKIVYSGLEAFFNPLEESVPRVMELKISYLKNSTKLVLKDTEEEGGFFVVSPRDGYCARLEKAVFTAGADFSVKEGPGCRKTANSLTITFDEINDGDLYLAGEWAAKVEGMLELKL
ncbi:MAG: sel1 repeat family protein [Lachnospiraceae bacterium]|nr:sel1 repeat family protein [Lachnospiraceae bacterium]